ncbi:MAG: ATP-binding protein [Pseudomonadota bacterium]|nr:ATP-binding protein [Pseudomonadota bacterium]
MNKPLAFWRLPPTTSLRARLLLYLSAGLLGGWLLANAVAMGMALHELDEAADSQMHQLARALLHASAVAAPASPAASAAPSAAPAAPAPPASSATLPRLRPGQAPSGGLADDRHHGMALWDAQGQRLLADARGQQLPWRAQSGFVNTGSLWRSQSWRVLYVHDAALGRTVAVAQHRRERLSTLLNVVWAQLLVSLLSLPLLAWLLAAAVRQGMAPLQGLAADLAQRQADSLQAVATDVPAEAQPLVHALNRLLARVGAAIEREQRFTADASHELRSPLAALKVQTEALALSPEPVEQQHHLRQIGHSLQRAERLIEQLLTLARLDPDQTLPQPQPIDWLALSDQALHSVNLAAREKRIRLRRELPAHGAPALPLQGDATLLHLLLRNLLDNAVRYAPEDSQVTLALLPDALEVRDQGPGIADEHLPRIRERFYRPSGQNEQGSGLGLSIIERIAQLHGLRLALHNLPGGGLCARIEAATPPAEPPVAHWHA